MRFELNILKVNFESPKELNQSLIRQSSNLTLINK